MFTMLQILFISGQEGYSSIYTGPVYRYQWNNSSHAASSFELVMRFKNVRMRTVVMWVNPWNYRFGHIYKTIK